MKQSYLLLLFFFVNTAISAQISYGGSPLFPTQPRLLRSTSDLFIEMPAFDVEEMLKEDSLNASNMRGSFRFAKKFFTSIERGVHGQNYTLEDGTRVWQVGIRSKGAYSLNLLFSEYEVPEGGKLFLYNLDHSHIIGSFTHENNSEDGILPIRPVEGEELIVEYTEPAGVAFEGRLKISEVNHDYRGFLRAEPNNDASSFQCMPDVLCVDDMAHPENIRATVLLMIDGTTGCSGALINNTENDGEPYLLTAVHCLNTSFPKNRDFYVTKSGTIITFFNYNRNICGSKMRATEEQTLAGAIPAAIIERKDIALLRLKDTPPDYYTPYYAGWNIDKNGGLPSYVNLHHPIKSLKKYGRCDDNITLGTINLDVMIFDPNSHWKVPQWSVGATAEGSSGSPLFDTSGLIVGGLTGGESVCNGISPTNGKSDFFFALYLGWSAETYPANTDPINQLKTYLDPKNTGITQLNGYDPYENAPAIRLSNVDYNAGTDSLVNTKLNSPATGYLFGHNSLKNTVEFAEEFNIGNQYAEVIGAYYFVPPLAGFTAFSSIKMKIYSGTSAPEIVKDSITFYPYFKNYTTTLKFYDKLRTMTAVGGTENFVKFAKEPKVGERFFISYEIQYPNTGYFSVYNTKSLNGTLQNSAWIKYTSGQWVPATGYTAQPMPTSLAIQPVIRYTTPDTIEEHQKLRPEEYIHYDRSTGQLVIDSEWASAGRIELYSITGQLLWRNAFIGDSPVYISIGRGQSIGIVKVITTNQTLTQKIFF